MKISYYKAHSTERPLEVDTTSSKNGVYLRKNIQEIQQETQEGGAETIYEYDEAYLTNSEYAAYSDIDNLTMTALDFIKVLEAFGITRQEIHTYLDANPYIKDELTYCQNVYCGVVKQFCPATIGTTTVTTQMVENAFRAKLEIV